MSDMMGPLHPFLSQVTGLCPTTVSGWVGSDTVETSPNYTNEVCKFP